MKENRLSAVIGTGESLSQYLKEPAFVLGMEHARKGVPPCYDAYRSRYHQGAYERGRLFALSGRRKSVAEYINAARSHEVI